jgi:hypothetical protein
MPKSHSAAAWEAPVVENAIALYWNLAASPSETCQAKHRGCRCPAGPRGGVPKPCHDALPGPWCAPTRHGRSSANLAEGGIITTCNMRPKQVTVTPAMEKRKILPLLENRTRPSNPSLYRLSFHALLISTVGRCEWLVSCLGRFHSVKTASSAHWIGGWVGPRANHNTVRKTKHLIPVVNRTPIPRSPARSPVTIPTEKYWSVQISLRWQDVYKSKWLEHLDGKPKSLYECKPKCREFCRRLTRASFNAFKWNKRRT